MSQPFLKVAFGVSITFVVLGLLMTGFLTGWLIFAPGMITAASKAKKPSVIQQYADETAEVILRKLSIDPKTKSKSTNMHAQQPTTVADTHTSSAQHVAPDQASKKKSIALAGQDSLQPTTTNSNAKHAATPHSEQAHAPAAMTVAQKKAPQQSNTRQTAPVKHVAAAKQTAEHKQAAKPKQVALQKYSLLLGTYISRAEAETEATRIANVGEQADIFITNEFPQLYSVLTGEFAKEKSAQAKANELAKEADLNFSIIPASTHRKLKTTAGTPVWLAEFMSFLTIEAAHRQKDQLMRKGINAKILKIFDKEKRPWFVVVAGHFPQKTKAENTCTKLSKKAQLPCQVRPIAKSMVVSHPAKKADG